MSKINFKFIKKTFGSFALCLIRSYYESCSYNKYREVFKLEEALVATKDILKVVTKLSTCFISLYSKNSSYELLIKIYFVYKEEEKDSRI